MGNLSHFVFSSAVLGACFVVRIVFYAPLRFFTSSIDCGKS